MNYFAMLLELCTLYYCSYTCMETIQGNHLKQTVKILHIAVMVTIMIMLCACLPASIFYPLIAVIYMADILYQYRNIAHYIIRYVIGFALISIVIFGLSFSYTPFIEVSFIRDTILLTTLILGAILYIKKEETVYEIPHTMGACVLCGLFLVLLLYILCTLSIQNMKMINIVPCCILLCILSWYRVSYRNEVSKEHMMQMLEQQYTRKENMVKYERMEQEQARIQQTLHDLQKHLRLLETISNQDEEVVQYRNQVRKQVQDVLMDKPSGNPYIDRILTMYNKRIQELHITLNLEIDDVDISSIDGFDLCGVMMNLLENAIESCSKCENRFILLRMKKAKDNFIIIRMKNSCIEIKEEKGHILTTKKNALHHGFGLRNMRMVAQRYDGNLSYTFDEKHKIFVTTLLLRTTDVKNKATSTTL